MFLNRLDKSWCVQPNTELVCTVLKFWPENLVVLYIVSRQQATKAKECALSTGYLPRIGLPRNSVDRITDLPNMSSAVDRGRKVSTQTNKQKCL